jgi:hypothetical protein
VATAFKYSIARGCVSLRFDAKPSEDIRAALKANGFRWSPGEGIWWRRKVTGSADFLTWLEKACNPGRPDGACWDCGDARGFFRGYGAATPVYCDACEKTHREAERAAWAAAKTRCPDDPMGVDTLYEDTCRDQCGL